MGRVTSDDSQPVTLRWRLAEDDSVPDALFPDESIVQRHVGTGAYRGIEFYEVNAKKVVNRVPKASRMPFQYTINPYRGCSHACSYCLAGDTEVLVGDGRTKRLAELLPGEVVCGTQRAGAGRRYVETEVLDHWSTVKPAIRIILEDGTELVASADHRFLSTTGWTRVKDLRSQDRLVRVDDKCPRIAIVEPMGVDLPMFDITTGTGDFVANGVVSHNCFARPTHEYLGLGIGEDFDRKIVVKVNAVERAGAELRSRRWAGDHIAMGTNTDPYQKAEGKYHLTRGIIEVLGAMRNPFSILTKSTLVLRDLDVLTAAAARTDVRLNMSIGTLDRAVWRLSEPGTPPPDKRVDAVRRLNDAGIPCGVLVAPILPGLSDSDDQLQEVVDACVSAGAVSISAISLHLRPGVREHYLGWLARERPDLVPLYATLFTGPKGPRAYQPKARQDELSARVRRMVREAEGRFGPPRTMRATPPAPPAPALAQPDPSEQLSLL